MKHRRLLTWILTLCMLLTMLPVGVVPALAAGESVRTSTTEEDTANSVNAAVALAAALKSANSNIGRRTGDFTWDTERKTWSWTYYNGIIMDAFLMLDSDAYLSYVNAFFNANVSTSGQVDSTDATNNRYRTGELDSIPPARVLFDLLRADNTAVTSTLKTKYRKMIDYVYSVMLKFDTVANTGGNFKHKMNNSNWATYQVALDGLYMAQPFFMEIANALDDGLLSANDFYTYSRVSPSADSIYNAVVSRMLWIGNNLYDGQTHLYNHGWGPSAGVNGQFWLRSVGWYAAALADVISMLPDSYSTQRDELIAIEKQLFDGMMEYQDADTGMWYNVINYGPELSYNGNRNKLETSGSALIAYAMMRSYVEGFIGDEYAEAGLRAFNGTAMNELSGSALGDIYISSGVSTSPTGYLEKQYVTNEAKGVGPFLMAASYANEAAEIYNSKHPINLQCAENGIVTVTVNGQTAAPDETGCVIARRDDSVTVTIQSNEGYVIANSELNWQDKNTGLHVEEPQAKTDTAIVYEFTMPEYPVNVSCGFSKLVTISFAAGGGTGAMDDVQLAEYESYPLPECDFTAPEGMEFAGWQVGEAEELHQPGEDIDLNDEDITLTAVWEKALQDGTVFIDAGEGTVITAYIEDSESEGGSVSNGDTVPAGTVLKVNARLLAGYEFTQEPEESYIIDGDLTITARARKQTYALTLTHEGGAQPAADADDLTHIPYGTAVTVTAGDANEGYEFIGWYQTNGKLLTSSDTYTVTLYNDMTLEARYQQAAGIVTFLANGNVQKTVTASQITESDLPSDPTPYFGFEFDSWDMTIEQINSALATGNVTVTAKFKPEVKAFTVTIYNGENETPTETSYTESTVVKLKANTVSGKSFAYWTMDGEVLSYNANTSFRANASCTLTAVYSTDTVEAIGTAVLKTSTYNMSTKKLVTNVYLTVPEGATITAAGLLAASPTVIGTKYADTSAELTENNADYVKSSTAAVGKSAPVSYTWTKSSVNPTDEWYLRAYITYTLNNETRTIYGDRVTLKAGNDYDSSEKGTAAIRSKTYTARTNKAQFNAYLTVPEGGVISKAGLVASSSQVFNPAENVLTAATAQYIKSSTAAVGKSAPVSYTWTKSSVNPGDTWYVRAYLVYTLDGTEHTVYGNLEAYTAPTV